MVALDTGARAAADGDAAEGHGGPGAAASALPDRYRFRRRLGTGASGPVALAVDTRDGGLVAVKRMAPGEAARREAEALGALRHSGVVRLKDWQETPDAAFLVTEFVDGPDLEAFLASRAGRLDGAALRALLLKLADSVEAVHAAGFLHRDLKPANVLVCPDGTPVLTDFGAAVPIADIAGGGPSPWSSLTDGYAAPEQYARDVPEGPWTDVYGLGAIAHRALTGRAPPPAPARARGEPLTPGAIASGPDAEGLSDLIGWALALEPGDRPQTVGAWRSALASSAGRPAARRPEPDDGRDEEPDDGYPPTVRVQRVPGRDALRRRMVPDRRPTDPSPSPARRRWRARLPATLLLLAALGAGLAAAAWYGRPLYERHVKDEWIVDATGGGDTLTIADALARARDGATILIRPGTYAEGLALDRPLHLRAAVPGEAPLVAPEAGPCLLATGAGATVSGLHMRSPAPPADAAEGEPPASPTACLEVAGGDVRVDAGAIAGGGGPAVLVRDGASPVIVGNAIGEGAGPGVVIAAGARGLIADNTVSNVAGPGLIVRSGAAPDVTNNTFEGAGVVFAEGARGIFARNRVLSAPASAIEVTTGADPVIADNVIEQPGEAAVFVHDHGRGHFEGNTATGSGISGVVIASGGAPRLEDNRVQGSGEHGVVIVDRGGAVLERNAIEGSAGHGIAIGPDAAAEVELIDNRLEGNQREPQLLDARDD